MKENLYEFLEIGKLDKGLFRVWIVLTILWVSFLSFAIFDEGLYSKYKEEKAKSYVCIKDKDNKYRAISSGKILDSYFLKFDNLKNCQSFSKSKRNDLIYATGLTLLTPIIIIILWFFFKKTFLWLYRGFR